MAITHTESSVLWATTNYDAAVGANSTQTSDVLALDATCVNAQITLKAVNGGTPASGDVIYFYLLQSAGDPDGNGVADEYDTTGHATFLAALDTTVDATAIKTVPLPLPQKGLKVYAEGTTATTTQSITVSAVVLEQRAA